MSESMQTGQTGAAQSHPELIEVAETVARDKGIEREEVLEAMEQAIQKAGRSKYGHEHDIRATIDRQTGERGTSRGKSTRIFVKENGRWLCIHGHYTLVE